jgi:hypothetical protein
MNTGTMVAAMTGAGIVGGVVGAMLGQGDARPETGRAAPSVTVGSGEPDEALAKEIASLRARLDEMQASVAAATAEATRIQGEVERERATAAEARKRIEAIETANATAAANAHGALAGRSFRLAGADGAGGEVLRFTGAGSEQMKKVQELRALPEDERWAKARDALGLSGGQEDELKAAIKERNEALRAAITVENRGADGGAPASGEAISVRAPDIEKLREARKKYDDRVSSALTPDQSKKWRDEGYEAALGGGSRSVIASAVVVEGDR